MGDVTAQEIIETIKRSSLLTIVSEGKEDAIVARPIERNCADLGVSFLPVGGKSRALEVWDGLPLDVKQRCALWVDKDLWVFFGVPTSFPDDRGVLTEGYSIENDLFADFDFCRLMSDNERIAFFSEVELISSWFGETINKVQQGQACEFRRHPNDVLNELNGQMRVDPMSVFADFQIKLRGKTLFATLLRQLSRGSRKSKYSNDNLIEMGSNHYGLNMQRIETRIREIFESVREDDAPAD